MIVFDLHNFLVNINSVHIKQMTDLKLSLITKQSTKLYWDFRIRCFILTVFLSVQECQITLERFPGGPA